MIFLGSRKAVGYNYHIQILLSDLGTVSVLITNIDTNAINSIEITKNIKYLQPNNNIIKTHIGKEVFNKLTFNQDLNLFEINESKLINDLEDKVIQLKNNVVIKLQKKYRKYFAGEQCSKVEKIPMKTLTLLQSFGIKIGKQYHLIKVLSHKENADKIIVKSNHSKNSIEISLKRLLKKQFSEYTNLIDTIQRQLINVLAFDPIQQHLVIYNRKNN